MPRIIAKPQTFLIARPSIDVDEMMRYLKEVGGESWATRMGLDDPGGDFYESLSDGEVLVEFGGRECYRSWEPGLNANVTKVREDSGEYLTNILGSGHGSVIEHAHYSFQLHNVSRVFTHELVRHRHENISQESMRFVRLTDIPFWMPRWAQTDWELADRCFEILTLLEKHQEWMAEHFDLDNPEKKMDEKKAKTSFMRRFAPDGVATGMLWTANIRGLRHIVTMRTERHAEEEIRLVFDDIAAKLEVELPNLFSDFERVEVDGIGEWKPAHRKV